MDISIIIVNFNVKHFLANCLQSIFQSNTHSFQYEVIVVDNNSQDGSVTHIGKLFGEDIILVENKNNEGFAKACNQGFKHASGDIVLFLNPDTLLGEDTLPDVLKVMSDPEYAHVAALGVKLVDGKGDFLPESKRAFPGIWNSFCKLSGLSDLFGRSQWFSGYNLSHLDQNKKQYIQVLCGAFILVRRRVFIQIGGFDESFFMYGEDIDLSKRIIDAGHAILYFPETSIIHFKGESVKERNFKYYRTFYKAMDTYSQKHFNWVTSRLLSISIYLTAVMAYLVGWIKKRTWLWFDCIVFYFLFQTIRYGWAWFHFGEIHYYQDVRINILFALYSIMAVSLLWLAGHYTKSSSLRNTIMGTFFTTLAAISVYSLLPLEWRFSRAIVLLFTPVSFMYLLVKNGLQHYFAFGKWGLFQYRAKKIGVVANVDTFLEINYLLDGLNEKMKVMGRIEVNEVSGDETLGHMDQLKDLIVIYDLDELVFSIQDAGLNNMLAALSRFGSLVKFKVYKNDTSVILGSHDPLTSGEFYTQEVYFNINSAVSIFLKRSFDISVSVLLLLIFPFLLFFNQGLLKDAWVVLIGKKSWVGYIVDDVSKYILPSIKEGILECEGKSDNKTLKAKHLHNLVYARNYSVLTDLEWVLHHFFRKKS